ncbi:MAG: DUF1839 family protein [Rhodospirillales bacterium]|nr:MAG: DUF1839 family protein [Rhodospirillales bacterium]
MASTSRPGPRRCATCFGADGVTAAARFAVPDPAAYRQHALHAADRRWPETNCYVDLWIELLHANGFDPVAGLAFTVAQDFEGDQFTFFKHPLEDLRALHGLSVQELAVYDTVEAHVAEQLARGRLVLVEMDSFYLPDTRGTAYRREHVKTTVGVASLDTAARRMVYFHNAVCHALEGEDFDGVFRRLPAQRDAPDALFPYVEFVKRDAPALEGGALRAASLALLRGHLARRPADPIGAFRAAFPAHMETLLARPMAYFHLYAFNLLRQLGANFELLGSYLRWLDATSGTQDLEAAAVDAERIADTAKAMQFQIARGVNRRKPVDLDASFDALAKAYGGVFDRLAQVVR